MTKKTHQKKKVTIKLDDNQSYIIEDIQVLLHVQKTYADMLRAVSTDEDKALFARIISAVNEAIENVFYAQSDGIDDEW